MFLYLGCTEAELGIVARFLKVTIYVSGFISGVCLFSRYLHAHQVPGPVLSVLRRTVSKTGQSAWHPGAQSPFWETDINPQITPINGKLQP